VDPAPIACSLSESDAALRVLEWHDFLAADVAEVRRTAGSARLRLTDTEQSIVRAVDLARRERACCGFFDFRVVPLPDAVWLEVDAPAPAAALIDDLFGPAR
jgi:MerR family copper efflux transcriptional regulator